MKLAYPKEMPTWQRGDSLLRCSEDEYVHFDVRVGKDGRFDRLLFDEIVSEDRLKEYDAFLQKIRFRPGRFKGSKVAQILPVTLYLFADHRPPIVTFPVMADGRITDAGLFRKALELNGVNLPHLQRFPSYHSTLLGADSTAQLRYVLTSLNLDARGVPSRVELARTNYPEFAGQILNAVNWGMYSSARVDTQAVASSCFLLVTFFPSMPYPSQPLIADTDDAPFSLEQLAVRLLPDTLGDISDPIPRYIADWTYPLLATRGSWSRQGTFRYRIDAFGNADLVSGGNGSPAARQFGASLATVMRFYPAVDKRGGATSFEGAVRVTPKDKSNVRVEFLWLK